MAAKNLPKVGLNLMITALGSNSQPPTELTCVEDFKIIT